VRENVRAGQSVWTMPSYTAYPLMFHAPQALYAWQLSLPPEGQFTPLSPIHFRGLGKPDYLIAFGPALGAIKEQLRQSDTPNIQYRQVAVLDFFWNDRYRPELFWRTFTPVTSFNRETEAIYVFQLVSGPTKP